MLLEKILGTENPGDIFTKYLDQHTMTKALSKMNCEFREGRAKAAPDTMGLKKDVEMPNCGSRLDLVEAKRTLRKKGLASRELM